MIVHVYSVQEPYNNVMNTMLNKTYAVLNQHTEFIQEHWPAAFAVNATAHIAQLYLARKTTRPWAMIASLATYQYMNNDDRHGIYILFLQQIQPGLLNDSHSAAVYRYVERVQQERNIWSTHCSKNHQITSTASDITEIAATVHGTTMAANSTAATDSSFSQTFFESIIQVPIVPSIFDMSEPESVILEMVEFARKLVAFKSYTPRAALIIASRGYCNIMQYIASKLSVQYNCKVYYNAHPNQNRIFWGQVHTAQLQGIAEIISPWVARARTVYFQTINIVDAMVKTLTASKSSVIFMPVSHYTDMEYDSDAAECLNGRSFLDRISRTHRPNWNIVYWADRSSLHNAQKLRARTGLRFIDRNFTPAQLRQLAKHTFMRYYSNLPLDVIQRCDLPSILRIVCNEIWYKGLDNIHSCSEKVCSYINKMQGHKLDNAVITKLCY